MSRMIFVNLPVADLPRATRFYEAAGFVGQPQFTDETAGCLKWSEAIFVMLLTHEKWRTFTTRPVADRGASEVMLALTCADRDEVDRLAGVAARAGGTADVNPPQDHGFMFSRSFADPDGHVWEAFWMDPAAAGAPGADEPHSAEAIAGAEAHPS
jgi:uncharacterized protein